MRVIRIWLCCALMLSGAVSAATLFSTPGRANIVNPSDLNSWCPGQSFYTQDTATLYARVLGTQFEGGCWDAYEQEFAEEFLVTIIAVCPVTTTGAALTMLQTITAIDQFGQTTTGPTVTNPQCLNGCVVEHPSGSAAMTCSLYLNPTQTRTVGADGWTVCSGAPITFTGVSCNIPNSDLEGITNAVAKPLGYVLDAGPGDDDPGEDSGSSNATGFPIWEGSCADTNGDGKHDGTGQACSLMAQEDLAYYLSQIQNGFEGVGEGSSLEGDVKTLADANGGWFGLPEGIVAFLNPPAVCAYVFKLPEHTMLGANFEVNADGWCAVKVKIEPYLAFFMWAFTCLVLMAQFRRVQ